MNFPGGSICSSNRHEFSRRVYRKDMFFPGGSICSSNRPYYLIEQILIFPETLILVLEHIRIFQEPLFLIEQMLIFQEALSSPRTPTIFQETISVLEHIQFSRRPLCLEHIGIFQEGTPSRTDISLIGLGGCFRKKRKKSPYPSTAVQSTVDLTSINKLLIPFAFHDTADTLYVTDNRMTEERLKNLKTSKIEKL